MNVVYNSSFLLRTVLRILLYRILRSDLEREYLILLKENEILRRKQKRVLLLSRDRAFFIGVLAVSRKLIEKVRIIQPETILGWHRKLAKMLWPNLRIGRPPITEDVRALVLEMKHRNPRWGAQRIHGELKKLKIRVSKRSVARILKNAGLDPRNSKGAQNWFQFLRSHKNRIFACDFFQVQKLFLKRLSVFFIMDIHTKAILSFAVTKTHNQDWFRNYIHSTFAFMECTPDYLIADRDQAYGKWLGPHLEQNFGIKFRQTPAFRPWFNCYAERVVRTIREELTDRVLIFNDRDVEHLLKEYVAYYNESRVHSSLGFNAPRVKFDKGQGPPADLSRIKRRKILDGLITDFAPAA